MLLRSQDYDILKCAACSFAMWEIICVQGCDDIVLNVNMHIKFSAAIYFSLLSQMGKGLVISSLCGKQYVMYDKGEVKGKVIPMLT